MKLNLVDIQEKIYRFVSKTNCFPTHIILYRRDLEEFLYQEELKYTIKKFSFLDVVAKKQFCGLNVIYSEEPHDPVVCLI